MELIKSKVIWCQYCTYFDKNSDIHSSNFFHYVYCVSGGGYIVIEKHRYPIIPGQLYLISPFSHHRYLKEGAPPIFTLEIKFEIFDEDIQKRLSLLPHVLKVNNNYPIENILSVIQNENKLSLPFSKDIVEIKMHEFLTYLLRFLALSKNNKDANDNNSFKTPNELDHVINYINLNIAKELTLDQLANIACLEKTYFVKKFKKRFNKAPITYIREERVFKAIELLKHSDMSVTQIAYSVGFKNIHHFSSFFLKTVGERPQAFKNKIIQINQPFKQNQDL